MNYDKWNRRLINLCWLYAIIAAITSAILFFIIQFNNADIFSPLSFPVYIFGYVILPPFLMVLVTVICKVSVAIIDKKHGSSQPYIIISTVIIHCSIMLMAHYGIPVLFSAYFVPIMFALIYNDKRILLFSYIGSACAFIGCCVLYATVLARLPRPEVFREGFHSGDVITTLALLTAAYFICRIIIKRYGEIIELLMTKERELNESKVAIMLSQIQPHFLYNALTAITQLCDENPKKAKETTIDFSEYLRGNMDSLNEKRLISIEKELNHVKGYLNLEKAIYGKALNIVYRVETDDVSLPPLTIQPVVENAVKHGIGKKEGGGTITVSVCETEESYLVIVSDDGAGYDVNERSPDKRQHIGIDNVRQRLGQCGGTLELLSELGKGTTATIKLPKERHIVQ